MHYPVVKQKVLLLRKRGSSISDIAKRFKVSKSTISLWCRDISLSEESIERISQNGRQKLLKAILKYSEIKRSERIQRVHRYKQQGKSLAGALSQREMLMVGLGLYWGEGYKESNGELGFTNSNPAIIQFYMRWLTFFNVKREDLIFRLTINSYFESEKDIIKKFWAQLLRVDENQFSKTTIIKSVLKKASLEKSSAYRGILRVKVRRGLALKHQILGAIEHISTCS